MLCKSKKEIWEKFNINVFDLLDFDQVKNGFKFKNTDKSYTPFNISSEIE